MSETKVTDGETIIPADELRTGRLYVLEETASGDHLRHLPRSDDELPKIRIMPDSMAALRTFCSGARKGMKGFKPDLTMAASALLLDAVNQPDAVDRVRKYFLATLADPEPSDEVEMSD